MTFKTQDFATLFFLSTLFIYNNKEDSPSCLCPWQHSISSLFEWANGEPEPGSLPLFDLWKDSQFLNPAQWKLDTVWMALLAGKQVNNNDSFLVWHRRHTVHLEVGETFSSYQQGTERRLNNNRLILDMLAVPPTLQHLILIISMADTSTELIL